MSSEKYKKIIASPKKEIGERLRQFGQSKFKTVAEFARALGVRPQNLNSYLNGSFTPGNKMEEKLRALGCDIIWLEHGATKEEMDRRFNEMVGRISKSDITEAEKKILAVLRGFEIEDVYEFEQCFSVAKAAAIKMEKLTKRNASKAVEKNIKQKK